MSAGWVAGSVRARALARRHMGAAAARRIAESGSLVQALRALATTPYGRHILPGQTVEQAQHKVAATVLWDLRVLAGWLPRGGVGLLRAVAGWFEIANVDELLTSMTGGRPGELFELGALATAWPRLRRSATPAALRAALAESAWADPGGDTAHDIRFGMRARWGTRVAGLAGPATPWAAGAMALLVSGERFAAGRELTPAASAAAAALLGRVPLASSSLPEFAGRLPGRARWALARSGSRAHDLWRAEAAWWARVEADGTRLLRGASTGSDPVLGSAAILAADAWRVRAAIGAAAWGGEAMDAYDAVA